MDIAHEETVADTNHVLLSPFVGVSQIFVVNNPWSGALILIAMAYSILWIVLGMIQRIRVMMTAISMQSVPRARRAPRGAAGPPKNFEHLGNLKMK